VTVHELKCWPPYFGALADGSKTFEVRHNDRGFQAGDSLLLREWDPRATPSTAYTGRELHCQVTYVLQGGGPFVGLKAGYAVLALRITHAHEPAGP